MALIAIERPIKRLFRPFRGRGNSLSDGDMAIAATSGALIPTDTLLIEYVVHRKRHKVRSDERDREDQYAAGHTVWHIRIIHVPSQVITRDKESDRRYHQAQHFVIA